MEIPLGKPKSGDDYISALRIENRFGGKVTKVFMAEIV